MRRRRTTVLTAAALAGAALAAAAPASAQADQTWSFAVIGDVPYGDAMLADFPAFIDRINADPDVRMVSHLGDIKSGSTTCDNERFAAVRRDFDRFDDPLVYTPGDNEWTDCHRLNNGGYEPLERLGTIRQLFFDRPGRTLGKPVPVKSQDTVGFPENVRYTRAGVSFATLHVVGSNNDLAPWSGLGYTTPTPQQVAEEQDRMEATIANMRSAFDQAEADGDRAVVLMQQADMFDDTVDDPQPADYSAFRPLVQAMIEEANDFDGPVYLFNGDSHEFNQDHPLADGSPWLSFYGVHGSADNLTRVTVDGAGRGEDDYVKATVHSSGKDTLSVERVPAR